MALALNTRAQGSGPPLLILHGLFGSSANWSAVAKRLSGSHAVILPDLRNHGASPHDPEMSYASMCADLVGLQDRLGIDRCPVIGHSMGGKVAMWLALTRPERVSSLVVVDVAPVHYHHDFSLIIAAMRRLDPGAVKRRADADAALEADLPEVGLRQFILQNLLFDGEGYRWRVNLDALESGMADITGFPRTRQGQHYGGPALFVHGAESDYVDATGRREVLRLFPNAELVSIGGAGHWLHVEQPDRFLEVLERFLRRYSY